MFEHPSNHLILSRVSRVQWFRERIEINSAELAKLRWSEGWKIKRSTAHFGVGMTFLKQRLSELQGAYFENYPAPSSEI